MIWCAVFYNEHISQTWGQLSASGLLFLPSSLRRLAFVQMSKHGSLRALFEGSMFEAPCHNCHNKVYAVVYCSSTSGCHLHLLILTKPSRNRAWTSAQMRGGAESSEEIVAQMRSVALKFDVLIARWAWCGTQTCLAFVSLHATIWSNFGNTNSILQTHTRFRLDQHESQTHSLFH